MSMYADLSSYPCIFSKWRVLDSVSVKLKQCYNPKGDSSHTMVYLVVVDQVDEPALFTVLILDHHEIECAVGSTESQRCLNGVKG